MHSDIAIMPPGMLRRLVSNTRAKGNVAAQKTSAPIETASQSNGWLVDPVIDILFCCGGLVWIFFAVHFFILGPESNGPAVQAIALFALAGGHALSETHTAATLVRLYGKKEMRRRYSFCSYGLALGCTVLLLAGLLIPGVTPILAKIYLIWVIQHFTAQTYGLTLLYCAKGNYKLSSIERRTVHYLLNATALYAVVRMFTLKEFSANGFLAQHIPFWGPFPLWVMNTCGTAVAICAAAYVSLVLFRGVRKGDWVPLPAFLLVATGVAIFVLGKQMSGIAFLYVPAFFHGSQYVVLCASCYLKEQSEANGQKIDVRRDLFKLPGLKYQLMLFVIGMFIFLALPRLLQDFGFSFTLAFATIFCCINLHHFVTDAVIWKMRDPETRKLLLA